MACSWELALCCPMYFVDNAFLWRVKCLGAAIHAAIECRDHAWSDARDVLADMGVYGEDTGKLDNARENWEILGKRFDTMMAKWKEVKMNVLKNDELEEYLKTKEAVAGKLSCDTSASQEFSILSPNNQTPPPVEIQHAAPTTAPVFTFTAAAASPSTTANTPASSAPPTKPPSPQPPASTTTGSTAFSAPPTKPSSTRRRRQRMLRLRLLPPLPRSPRLPRRRRNKCCPWCPCHEAPSALLPLPTSNTAPAPAPPCPLSSPEAPVPPAFAVQ